ncbi:MAG: hypothetical protein RL729_521 [Actinomycetota bacterium]
MKNLFNRAFRSTRVLAVLVFASVFVVGEYLVVAPKPAQAAGPRVTLCHRTKSTTNPYRLITVSNSAVNGHGNHTGSVWTPSNANGDTWGDIIPDNSGDGLQFWANGSVSNKDLNWAGDSTSGGRSFMLPGGANVSKCSRMTAKRFYEISKQAGQTDTQIAADLESQEANEDAAVRPVGGFTAANVASSVGSVSVTTKTPSAIGTTTATLEGTITAGSTSTTPKFEWGTSATLDTFSTTTAGTANTGTFDHSASISGLTSGTTYYYRVIGEIGSTDTLGTYYGNIVSFTAGKTLRTVTVTATSTTIAVGQTTSLGTTLSAGTAGSTTYEVVNGLLYCSISGTTLTADATNTGTCSIRATDGGDSTYSAATSPTIDITVTSATSRTLTIDAASYSGSPYSFTVGTKPTITSTASAGDGSGTKSYSSSTTSVCTINSSTGLVAFVDAGTCTIAAAITAAGGFSSANATAISFTITSVSRTLSLSGDSGPYAINATPPTMVATPSAGSGSITYTSSTTSICTVNSSTGVVVFVDAGTCTIGSSIASNSGYASATSSTRTFTITAISRTLTIDAGSYNATYAGNATPPTITSTASAGAGTKQYSSSTPSVCTINSSTGVVTFVDAGTCTIGATISSAGSYASATASSISFTITSSPPTSSTTSSSTTTTTTTVAGATTTTVRATPNATTTTISQLIVNNSRRISICHATSSATNPYVLITVDRNSLNGHGDHDGDIIPAPAGGCPTSRATQIATTSTSVAAGRISICHANANGTYSQITVAANSLNGHGDHLDDIIPAPSDGCPYSVRQYALQLVRTSSTTTTPGAVPGVSATTVPSAVDRSKITICHATAAGFYVEITVDRSGLNGHGDHDGDIIPAPASGCPTAVSRQVAPTTTVPAGKIAICHATAAGIYVSIVVDRDGLNGHGDHAGDLIPAPAGGCPTRMSAQSAPNTIPKPPAGKIGICHASAGGSLQYVLVDKETLDGHGDHGQDIIPAPITGCSNPSSTISPPTTVACINARELENFDESANSLTDGVKVSAAQSPTDDDSGTIKISNTTSGPALSLVSAESVDTGIKVTVKSSGVDYNKAITWVNEGYGSYCWKLEPFGDRDYIYTLPNPPAPPDSRYAGLPYSTVIVKAGSLTTTDPNYQVNSVFYSPEPGSGVFADVNKNGVSDPGGQGGGTLGDKSISHIVVCVGNVSSQSVASTTTLPLTSTTSPLLTTTTTINWSADFCPVPTTTTSITDASVSTTTTSSTSTTTTTTVPGASTTTTPGASTTSTTTAPGASSTTTTSTTTAPGASSSSTTTIAGGSTTTTAPGSSTSVTTTSVPGTVIATTTTQPGGAGDPNPPIEFIVESQSIPKDGVTDLVLTLSDGVKSEVVFLQLDVRNFSVVANSLPATGQERWSNQQLLGWLMILCGALFGAIEMGRRARLQR